MHRQPLAMGVTGNFCACIYCGLSVKVLVCDTRMVAVPARQRVPSLNRFVGGAVPSDGIGTMMLPADYWSAFGFSCLAAVVAGAVSFLHNVAEFLPEDPKSGY
jgi:hypothetical protein